ncbi:unnamed protein product [Gongylonema pulchrum]|uniref:Uncharacterized protein n=1 Tax=Gongylonema pulchrum TaxID=637853 RepID=A0A183DVF0_9BILA|nr:unnamed protein product [Gongylonema pulchrum]
MEGDQKQQQQLGSENGDGRPKPDDGFIASATNVSSKPDQTTHELTALLLGGSFVDFDFSDRTTESCWCMKKTATRSISHLL